MKIYFNRVDSFILIKEKRNNDRRYPSRPLRPENLIIFADT